MSYQYAERKRTPGTPSAQAAPAALVPDALRTGAIRPTQELLGRPVDLPGAIRSKMEASFGADLSSVKLYESQAVADAGANAMAQGSRIAFAPGALDFASTSGQALLGHELSHVVSQARGEVTGSGFLNDSALEARADREGAMAAAGQQVYAGPVTAPLSSAAPAAGPMQASKAVNKGKKHFDRIQKYEDKLNTPGLTPTQIKSYQKKQNSAKWWMNYWMPPQSPDTAITESKKHYDQMIGYDDLLADPTLSPESRAQYGAQREDAQKWMKFWGQWITPEAANSALNEHFTTGSQTMSAAAEAEDAGLTSEGFRDWSQKLGNEIEWQTFLLPYASEMPDASDAPIAHLQQQWVYENLFRKANRDLPEAEQEKTQAQSGRLIDRYNRTREKKQRRR